MATIERKTHTLDAEGQSVGRLASRIAILLRGKHKASYLPNIDAGDIVQVSNVANLKFTGKKLEQRTYIRHTGYPGGLVTTRVKQVFEKNPAQVLKRAVREMLPPIKARNEMLKRLIIK